MKKNRGIAVHEESDHGHARPWVWVMIDAFLLVTSFFVCTFHVKSDEPVLPQHLSNGGPGPGPAISSNILRVHVSRENGAAVYEYHSVRGSLAELAQSLAGARQVGNVQVRVGYDSTVPFGDVLAVMNACSRVGI